MEKQRSVSQAFFQLKRCVEESSKRRVTAQLSPETFIDKARSSLHAFHGEHQTNQKEKEVRKLQSSLQTAEAINTELRSQIEQYCRLLEQYEQLYKSRLTEDELQRLQELKSTSLIVPIDLGDSVTTVSELRKRINELQIDNLMKIPNRAYFEATFPKIISNAYNSQKSVSFIICDVDHFKSLNDTYGHLSGDECLKVIGELLSSNIRNEKDHVFRWGGEELIIIIEDSENEVSAQIAERIREQFERLEFTFTNGPKEELVKITASFGVYSFIPKDETISIEEIFTKADQALYTAKNNGRNQVVIWSNNLISRKSIEKV